jgi:methylenetetrahydrofolate reductase (NADPH)
MTLQVSFEFSAPDSGDGGDALAVDQATRAAGTAIRLGDLRCGRSTRERTHRTVKRILGETALLPAAHLTCIAATRAEVDEVARDYWDAGVRQIVALRGDPPKEVGRHVPHPDGYGYAADLVGGLKRIADFEVTVAAFPEGHPEATSVYEDLDNLKRKIDAGASRAITQFFFENDIYFRFLERCHKAGITCEIVPGIMPVTNFRQMTGFAATAGASVPRWMATRFEGLDDDPETRKLIAATVVAEQVQGLAAQGVREFHFYTLNRADLTFAICHLLGLRAHPVAAPA